MHSRTDQQGCGSKDDATEAIVALRRLRRPFLDADVRRLREESDGVQTAFTTDATLFDTTERGAEIAEQPAIDPENPGLDLASDPEAAVIITGPDRPGQAILGGVGHGHRFIIILEPVERDHWAKDLFRRSAGLDIEPVDYGWTEERAIKVRLWSFAPGEYLATLLLGQLDVSLDFVAVCKRDERAHPGCCRVTHRHGGYGRHQFVANLVVNSVSHEHPGAAQADLTLIRKAGPDDRRHHSVHVDVIEDDGGILAA
mmetsp:Transcript_3661/g.9141  ORF Transcript_3661/g.9141 Transcript_3661/m.9141 type:complete len:256 (-) Transcript_3661:820-1587(-)